MPLMLLEPPSNLPRGQYSRWSFMFGSASVSNGHTIEVSASSLPIPMGIRIHFRVASPPASRSRIEKRPLSLRREARAHPAEPAPTITKS